MRGNCRSSVSSFTALASGSINGACCWVWTLAGAFLVAAGLAQALDFLENLRFLAEDVDWLAQRGRFGKGLLDRLASFPLPAMPRDAGRHGLFANEPILRGTAPLPTAQLSRRVLSTCCFQTLIAVGLAPLRAG
jgi:nicotinate phosphoribosyltransferase